MKKRSFLETTSYSSFILIMTKMLGVVPVFFMGGVLGYSGLAAYSATYAIAVVALEAANGGIPLGISQFVSKSNAIGDYETSGKAVKMMLIVMFLFSTFIGVVLFFLAPMFSLSSPESIRESIVFSLRMFIPTIIMAPVLGVVRGFYNGNKDTVPGSFSQFVEQAVWLVSIFIFIYIANIISKDNNTLKIGLVIFANFVGILGAAYVLYRYWEEHKEQWNHNVGTQTIRRKITNKQIFATILFISLPAALTGLIMNSFQMVTNVFYTLTLHVAYGAYTEEMIKATFATLQFNSAKFVAIPLVIANTIALATLPFMSAAFKKRDLKSVKIQIKQSLLLSYVIVMFSGFAIWVFGPMLYHGLFFQAGNENGLYDMSFHALNAQIIRIDGFRGLFMGLATLMNVILITINRRWRALAYVSIGFVVKMVSTPVLLAIFGPIGDIFASDVAYLVIFILGFRLVLKYVTFPKRFYQQFIKILLINIVVAIVMYILIRLVGYQFIITNRLLAIIEVIGIGLIGMLIYGYLLSKANILKYIFINRL